MSGRVERDLVLLAGGAGFVGRALTAALLAQGRRVALLTRRPVPDAPRGVPVYCGGLQDESGLREVLPRCATVVHLASTTTPLLSADQPLLELEGNLAPTLRFLGVLQEFPAVHLLYVSTGGALYGDPGARPVAESAPLAPLSNHGAGKAALEGFLRAHAGRCASPLSILRPANLYGPGQPLRAGFGIVRTMLEHALRGTPLEIWGDGEAVRDFLFIDDMVDACLRLVGPPRHEGIFNVGSGRGVSLNALRALVERVCGRALDVKHLARRSGDVRQIVLDCARLRDTLQWRPRVPLEEGVRATWDWLRR